MKLISVIVTYNRKTLLAECLQALYEQTQKLDSIILIDNACTDGTYEYISSNGLILDNLIYKRLEENVGGAGGFYAGMKLAYEMDADWVWIMDDDTIPTKTALEELIYAIKILNKEDISFLASAVFGQNGESMNVPTIETSSVSDTYPNWYRYLKYGIVEINQATFVSLLINRDTITRCGLPCKDYFIWGDDTEYTKRIVKYYAPAYFVGKSVVIHKRNVAKPLFISDETNINRMKMHYYFVRNNLINLKEYSGRKACFRATASYLHVCWNILLHKDMKALKIRTVLSALRDYYLKKYDHISFEKRMELNGQEK